MLAGAWVDESGGLAVVIDEVALSSHGVALLPARWKGSNLVHSAFTWILPLGRVVFMIHKVDSIVLGVKPTL